MKKNDKKKIMWSDCISAMLPSVFFYSFNEVVGSLLTVYTATILGEFANAVFAFDLSYGLKNMWIILLCIGFMLFVIPMLGTIGEVLMFHNSLKHDRLVMGRYLDKNYISATKYSEGEAQYRLEQDSIDLRCSWISLVTNMISIPITFFYLLSHTLKISLVFTILIFCVSSIKLFVPLAIKNLKQKYDKQTREYRTQVRTYESEITRSPYTVKLFGLSHAMIARLDQLYMEFYKRIYSKDIICTTIANGVSSFLDTFCILILLLFGAIMVAHGEISAGYLASIIGFFSVANTIIQRGCNVIRDIPIVNNLVERVVLLYEDSEKLTGKDIEKIGKISARNLQFSYDDNIVFQNVNFDIYFGQKIAICGPNGCGKSTLTKLLCGLLKNYEGSLKLDDYEIKDIGIESWRRQFAYVAQDPYLFSGTVIENVCFGNIQSGEETAKQIMDELGIGYLANRHVSMSQKDLSGGERQKISIARALLKNTPVLIMDEPNNNLDLESLTWLTMFISQTSKTVIYISHNDDLSQAADYIIRL